ncbi:polyprenyl diphosphate synthase [Patescibacteria group bacterium]
MSKVLNLPKGTIVPDHIALIMDGNGRWARSRGLLVTQGHEEAAKSIRKVIKASRDVGVHTITLWGFSTENWKRPPKEVAKIMSIVKSSIQKELKNAEKEGVRFVHLGRKDRLPSSLMKCINKAEAETKENSKHILNMALDYGGRDEIVRAVKRLVADGISEKQIDENLLAQYLDTADQPYPHPDLLIRTSGEQRTSGFLPWQLTYAEMYFEPDHLPDFNEEKLTNAILDYSRRRRRFGAKDKISHFRFKPQVIAQLELNWWRLRKIPEGTKLVDYSIQHIKEQFGLSKSLSKKAAKYMVQAVVEGEKSKWDKAMRSARDFYKLIKEEVKLAFEPSLAASLQVKLWKDINEAKGMKGMVEVEETAKKLYSEVYRISALQATKLAHLRVMANYERIMAEKGMGDHHWNKAEDYLEKFYSALKERVA